MSLGKFVKPNLRVLVLIVALEMYGGVEAHWGLFDAAKNLKNITIPNCPVD